MYYNIYVLLVFLFAVLIKVNSNLLANKFCYDVVCCVVFFFHFAPSSSSLFSFFSIFVVVFYIVFLKICYFISLFKKKTHMAQTMAMEMMIRVCYRVSMVVVKLFQYLNTVNLQLNLCGLSCVFSG